VIQSPIQSPVQNIIRNGIFDADGIGETVFKLHNSRIREVIRGLDGTHARATGATVKDHENVIREVLSGEVRFQGQRRVENLFTASEDLSNAAWTKVNATVSNEEITIIDHTAAVVGVYQLVTRDFSVGSKVVFSFEAKSGTLSSLPVAVNGKTETANNADLSTGITLSADYQRFSFEFSVVNADDGLYLVLGETSGTTGNFAGNGTFSARNLQLQNKTGASDPTIPDSYVSTGVLSSPYHGVNVDGVKVFLTTNGNTVLNNIVTEATGTPITDAIGYFGEPASTNKCTNYNANPDAGLINVTLSDAEGNATLTRVTDATELAAAGLDGICTSSYVFKLDASGNSVSTAFCIFGGQAGNTNGHAAFVYMRVTAGTGRLDAHGQLTLESRTANTYAKIGGTFTPSVSARSLSVGAQTGSVVYFIVNQYEEKDFATSEIITEGSAVTRNKDDHSYPSDNIPVNDCAFKFKWTPTAAGQGFVAVCSLGSATDYLIIANSGSQMQLRKRVGGVNKNATISLTPVADTTYEVKGRLDSLLGLDIWVADTKGANNADTSDIGLTSGIFIGSHFDGTLTQTGGVDEFTTHQGTFSDAEMVAL